MLRSTVRDHGHGGAMVVAGAAGSSSAALSPFISTSQIVYCTVALTILSLLFTCITTLMNFSILLSNFRYENEALLHRLPCSPFVRCSLRSSDKWPPDIGLECRDYGPQGIHCCRRCIVLCRRSTYCECWLNGTRARE